MGVDLPFTLLPRKTIVFGAGRLFWELNRLLGTKSIVMPGVSLSDTAAVAGYSVARTDVSSDEVCIGDRVHKRKPVPKLGRDTLDRRIQSEEKGFLITSLVTALGPALVVWTLAHSKTAAINNNNQPIEPLQLHKTNNKEKLSILKMLIKANQRVQKTHPCLLYTSPSPRDLSTSRMPSSA